MNVKCSCEIEVRMAEGKEDPRLECVVVVSG